MTYFGTIDGPLAMMQEVPCMMSPVETSHNKYSTELQFENGGVDPVTSADSHKRYSLSYTQDFSDDGATIDTVMDYFHGQYGDGLIYFDDPSIPRGKNVLRRNWATPALIEQGYKNIVHPELATTEMVDVVGGFGAPSRALKVTAIDTVLTVDQLKVFTMVVPTGFTLHLSYRGSGTGRLYVIQGGVPGILNPNPIGGNGLFQGSTQVSAVGPETVSVAVYPGPIGAETTIQSIDAIILQTGETPPATGNHQPGRGVSGLKFSNSLPYSYQNAVTGLRSLSAELVEVGEWSKK